MESLYESYLIWIFSFNMTIWGIHVVLSQYLSFYLKYEYAIFLYIFPLISGHLVLRLLAVWKKTGSLHMNVLLFL